MRSLNMAKRITVIMAALVLTLAACTPLFAQGAGERILLYESDIIVNADATMNVVETITVNSTQTDIVHGIYRDFPTLRSGRDGRRMRVKFDVQEALRDGSPEPFKLEYRLDHTRVYIGSENIILQPGIYTYVLRYTTDRQIGFFRDHDELYWNVTGNKWQFPIDKVIARVMLPGKIPANKIRLEGYTGPRDARGKNFKAGMDRHNQPCFETTRPFSKGEGLTIIVGWPRGFTKEPAEKDRLYAFIADNSGAILSLAGLLVILGYFALAWSSVGRDPKKGTIIPLYTPPDGISPAAMRYIRRMGWDNKVMAAALINMAVKGYVTIEEKNGTYTVRRANAPASVLSDEEIVLAENLLGERDSAKLKNTSYRKVQSAIHGMKEVMAQEYRGSYFRANLKHFAAGVLISLTVLAICVYAGPRERSGTAAVIGWVYAWTGLTAGIIYRLSPLLSLAYPSGAHRARLTMNTWLLIILAIPFVIVGLIGMLTLAAATSTLFVIVILAMGSVNFLFYHLLKAPTKEGRKILDAIEGFKMYLSVAEGDALLAAVPAEKTVETFEKYLPFALALGVEQAWSERFADVLAQAGTPELPYRPSWYSGRFTGASGFAGPIASLGDVITGAVSSASASPVPSSGFGGGSSGGGGGGGGGGGW